jgi:DNA-binding CsgD family transcriptional regulator
MLETLREYASEKLHASGAYSELRRRHSNWYEQLVVRADGEWISPRQEYWLIRMGQEHPNVRQALEYCLAEPVDVETALRILVIPWRIYWWAHGLTSEGRQWAARVLQAATESTAMHARGCVLASHLAVYQGEYDIGRVHLDKGRALAQHSADPVALSYAGFAGGMHAIYTGDLSGAISAMEEGLVAAAAAPDVSWRLDLLLPLAVAYDLVGEKERATACHEESLALTEHRGEIFHRSYSLWSLGVATWQRGSLDRATELECEALHLKRALNDRLGAVFCLETLAAIAASQDRYERAAKLLGSADVLWQYTGSSPAAAQHLAGFHDECERRTRSALGEAAYRAALEQGAALSIDDGIAYALGEEQKTASPAPKPTTSPLTHREQQVAELIGRGLTNSDIASKLLVSERTAESHVEHILNKLGFASRAQIAAWSVSHGPADGLP